MALAKNRQKAGSKCWGNQTRD